MVEGWIEKVKVEKKLFKLEKSESVKRRKVNVDKMESKTRRKKVKV